MNYQIKQGEENDTRQESQSGIIQQKTNENTVKTPEGVLPPVQTKQGSLPPIQTKQNNLTPYQSKEGQKPTIQAKQRPVQRNTGKSGSEGGNTNESRVKERVGAVMGTSVNDAKVHYNSDKPAQLMAEATAQGNEVHLAPGKEKHLGHELTHVAQQKQGQVKPTIQANNGVGINNDPKLEKEADDVGAIAMGNQTIQAKASVAGSGGGTSQPVQLLSNSEFDEIFESLTNKYPNAKLEEFALRKILSQHVKSDPNLLNMSDLKKEDAFNLLRRHAAKKNKSLNKKNMEVDESIKKMQSFNQIDESGKLQSGNIENENDISLMNTEQRARLDSDVRNEMIDTSVSDMLERAEASKVEFDKKMKVAKDKFPNNDLQLPELKGRGRINQKVDIKYKNDPNRVIDVVRGTFVFASAGDLAYAAEVLYGEFNIAQKKNDIGRKTDTGYRDMKLNVRLDTGFMAEIQLQLQSLNDAKKAGGGHALYKLIRNADEGRPTAFANDDEGLQKSVDIKKKLDQVMTTLTEKANNSDDDLALAEANQHIVLLTRLKGEIGPGKEVNIAKESDTLTTLKVISSLVYENANKDLDAALSKQGKAKNFFTKLNTEIDERKAKKAEQFADSKGVSSSSNSSSSQKSKKQASEWFGNGEIVTNGNNESFTVTNVSGRNNNCLIYAISAGISQRQTFNGAQILRKGIGIDHNDFLENDKDIVDNICINLGKKVTINWWRQNGDKSIENGGQYEYGDGHAHGSVVHIVNVGNNHFQALTKN